jgi:hypothetical protein
MKSNNNNNDDDDDDNNNNNTAMGSVHARGDTFLTFGLNALTETNTSRLATALYSSQGNSKCRYLTQALASMMCLSYKPFPVYTPKRPADGKLLFASTGPLPVETRQANTFAT